MFPKVSCVVPARLASSRFPGKMLHPLLGIPIVVHTLHRALEAGCFDEILCLTDSKDIRDEAAAAGFRAELTGPAANGTERIGKYRDFVANDLVVNLQGDEPAFEPQALRLLHHALIRQPEVVHVLVEETPASPEDLANPNRCKAGLDAEGYVRDFYRRAPRRAVSESRLQMGAYGYAKDFLRRYAQGAASALELSESHELLRDLEMAPIRAHASPFLSQAVDVPGDAEEALALLRERFPEASNMSIIGRDGPAARGMA